MAKWGWFVGIGAALSMLGMAAAANLVAATIMATFALAAAMFAGGILQLVHAFGVRRWGPVLSWALSGLLYLAAAVSLLYDPLFGAAVITLMFAVFLLASGLLRAVTALRWRGRGEGWMLASGLVSVMAALVFLVGWPMSAVWLLGMVLALDLMFQGAALMLLGFALKPVRIAGRAA